MVASVPQQWLGMKRKVTDVAGIEKEVITQNALNKYLSNKWIYP